MLFHQKDTLLMIFRNDRSIIITDRIKFEPPNLITCRVGNISYSFRMKKNAVFYMKKKRIIVAHENRFDVFTPEELKVAAILHDENAWEKIRAKLVEEGINVESPDQLIKLAREGKVNLKIHVYGTTLDLSLLASDRPESQIAAIMIAGYKSGFKDIDESLKKMEGPGMGDIIKYITIAAIIIFAVLGLLFFGQTLFPKMVTKVPGLVITCFSKLLH